MWSIVMIKSNNFESIKKQVIEITHFPREENCNNENNENTRTNFRNPLLKNYQSQ